MRNPTDSRLKKLTASLDAKTQEGTPLPKPKKKKKPDVPNIDPQKFPEMSESELVEIAHLLGFDGASRRMPKGELIDLILGLNETEPEDPLDKLREVTHRYVQSNRSVMPSNMPCDFDCPSCPAFRMVDCYSANFDKYDTQP